MISRAYKSTAKREAMQEILRECIKEYKKRVAGEGA